MILNGQGCRNDWPTEDFQRQRLLKILLKLESYGAAASIIGRTRPVAFCQMLSHAFELDQMLGKR